MKKKWLLEISIFLLILVSCTLNATQEKAFSNQKTLYLNAVNDGSVLTVVSMTHPEFVAHVKKQGPEVFKSVFAAEDQGESQLGGQIIQETAKQGQKIHILFQVEIENFSAGKSQKQFVGISEDNGENWFFMPYKEYKNKQICKQLPRMIK